MRRSSLLVALSAAVIVTMLGQARRDTRPVVIRDTGTPTPDASIPKPPPPPPDLSAAAKAELAKTIASMPKPDIYFKLTPKDNFAVGKGFLVFKNAYFVSGEGGFAQWIVPANEQEKQVMVMLLSEGPGRRYLIDFAVSSNAKTIFKIWNGNKFIQSIQSTGVKGQHLVLLLETTDALWHHYEVSGGDGFDFYSCEVTRI